MPGKAVVRYTVPVCPTIAKPPDRTLPDSEEVLLGRSVASVGDRGG